MKFKYWNQFIASFPCVRFKENDKKKEEEIQQ